MSTIQYTTLLCNVSRVENNQRYNKGPNDRINQVRLSEALQSKLRDIAERDDRSLSYVIRKACAEFAQKDDHEELSLRDTQDDPKPSSNPTGSDHEESR